MGKSDCSIDCVAGVSPGPRPIRRREARRECGDRAERNPDIPDNVPADVLNKAECVVILPSVVKFAMGIGGSYGRGLMTCRGGESFDRPWGAPTMMMLGGGSIGFQLGGQATDFVLFIMNPRGVNGLLSSQVKLGADMSAAAGPKGRTLEAATDVTMRAEILSVPARARVVRRRVARRRDIARRQ